MYVFQFEVEKRGEENNKGRLAHGARVKQKGIRKTLLTDMV
jgi:hypothetical protein